MAGTGLKLAAAVVAAAVMAGSVKHAGGIAADLTSARGGNASANVSLARAMASQFNWTGSQWSCLYDLWQGESGFSQYADSETTGLTPPGAPFAYGIPQAYPATKMPRSAQPASLGGRSNRKAQIRWGLTYVTTTYGNPCNALAFKRAHNNEGY